MKNVLTLEDAAWSSDNILSYDYSISINKEDARRFLRAMDEVKALNEKGFNVNCLRLWDDDAKVEITSGDDEIICDVICARVSEFTVYWDLKNKHTSDVYETGVFTKEELLTFFNKKKKVVKKINKKKR